MHQCLRTILMDFRPIFSHQSAHVCFLFKFVQEYSAACCGDELDICESMVVKAFKGA